MRILCSVYFSLSDSDDYTRRPQEHLFYEYDNILDMQSAMLDLIEKSDIGPLAQLNINFEGCALIQFDAEDNLLKCQAVCPDYILTLYRGHCDSVYDVFSYLDEFQNDLEVIP